MLDVLRAQLWVHHLDYIKPTPPCVGYLFRSLTLMFKAIQMFKTLFIDPYKKKSAHSHICKALSNFSFFSSQMHRQKIDQSPNRYLNELIFHMDFLNPF